MDQQFLAGQILWTATKRTVLWIRISFNADLDPAFYLNVDADSGF
jgi:hypothetical protein